VPFRRGDVVGVVLALVVAATCVRLGLWQIGRLHQRQARNAVARAGWARPPLELGWNTSPDSVRNRRVHVRGIYDFDNERIWRPHMLDEAPGVDLVTPLRLTNGVAVMVDRGWVASADAYHVEARAYREPESADVVGLALAAPRTRGDVDPGKLKDSLPYALLPFVVQQLPDYASAASAAPSSLPRRLPSPELTNGPHLSYAIQWFSFAAIVLVGSFMLFRKTVRRA
jgi:surfeit locus 1 family protein